MKQKCDRAVLSMACAIAGGLIGGVVYVWTDRWWLKLAASLTVIVFSLVISLKNITE